MKLLNKFIFAVIIASASSVSNAEPYYVGGGYTIGSLDEDGEKLDLNSIFFRFGYEVNDITWLEFRVGLGVGDDSIDRIGYKTDLSVESVYGVYYKVGIPNRSFILPYGIFGYTRATIESSVSELGSNGTASESDFSYGVGAEINIGENTVFNVEYLMYMDTGEAELSGWSLGFIYRI